MARAKLFRNTKQLDEKPGDSDVFNLETTVKNIEARIRSQATAKRSSIIALLGPFGSGKSTILNEVHKRHPKDFAWLNFEVWRFANRQEIWDGFVIQLAAKLQGKPEVELADEIDGEKLDDDYFKKWLLLNGVLLFLSLIVSIIIWSQLHGSGTVSTFLRAYLKYALPTTVAIGVFAGLGALILRLKPFRLHKPIRRVFELEELLGRSLKFAAKPIVIVAEDVDRAGDEGLVFLETLRSFLSLHADDFEQPIIVIAPQSKDAFDALEHGGANGFERTLKIYDEPLYLKQEWSKDRIERLYTSLGTKDEYKDVLIEATLGITNSFGQNVSVRLLKHALREVNAFYEVYPSSRPEIALALVLSRYIIISMAGVNQPAQRTLMSGQTYNSGAATALFKAILATKDLSGLSTPNFSPEYTMKLKDLEGEEVAIDPFVRPNNSTEARIDIDAKYEHLLSPFA